MNHKISRFFCVKILILLGLVSSLQSVLAGELAEDTGAWLQIVGEGSLAVLDPKWEKGRVWLEGQSRFDGNWEHWYQGMVRTAVGYSLSDRATIWAGYTWLPTQNIGKSYISQQDVWPAFRYILPTDSGTFTFRTMWETNFLRGDQVRERPRQMIKFMHPFEFEPRLSFIAWDEAFYRVNTTTWGGKSGFDQNRVFGGLGWSFNKNVRAELGYLNQYIDDASHRNATMHHLGMASLFINF
ncbi:DUF2490 domain-containing protein [Methylomonas montana]|uniref:DUF2490 domain-containing protein n=1 Tax=Methylomonas montana TaxID=3058963 RepID=UPI002657DD31|nr:DUF2490 domain-containing protein [Methylomonas montana]WKJ89308.1 DUF2490 domain-containing protein [Methylomonas montana]